MNSYLEALRQAAVIFPIVAALFTVPYIAFNYHKYGSVFSLRIAIVYSFILYLICIYCLVILPLPTGEAAEQLHGHSIQLVPFAFLGDMAEQAGFVLTQPRTWLGLFTNWAFFTALFNLVMTLPFGVYLRYYFRCSWRKTLVLSFLLSLFFELTQLSGLYFIYPGSYRVCDVDDLITNTAGSMLGYLLGGLACRFLPSREEIDRDSFRRGRQVSLPRRVLALVYDGAVCVVLTVLLFLFSARIPLWDRVDYPALLWAAYFLLTPALFRGQTVGHRFTRLRVVRRDGAPARWYQPILRYGLLLLVLEGAPRLLNWLVEALNGWGVLGGSGAAVASAAGYSLFLVFLLLELLLAALHRPLFYERLSCTRLVSTVEPEEDENAASSAAGPDSQDA